MSKLKTPFVFALGGVLGYLFNSFELKSLPFYSQYIAKHQQQQKPQQIQLQHKLSLPIVSNTQKTLNTQDLVESPIQTVTYPNFKIVYSRTLRIPLAVQQTITKQYTQGSAQRSNVFFQQRQIPSNYRSKQEHFKKTRAYKKLNISRGHMSAAGNFNFNRQYKDNTFTYANIVPQDSDNNQDTWLTFETIPRQLISKCDTVDIISGPIFKPSRPDSQQTFPHPILRMQYNILDLNGPAVPTHLYKIIKCNEKDKSHVSAFEFKNRYSYDNKKQLKQFQVSLQYLQKITGLQFKFHQTDSLVDFDPETFQSTKQQYNKRVLYPKILKAKKYDEVQNQIRKIKSHKLKHSEDIGLKIQELVDNKLLEQEPDACKKVLNYLNLQSNLRRYKYLNDKIKGKIVESINESLTKCNDKELLERIKTQLFYSLKYEPKYSEKITYIENKLQSQQN